MKGKAKQAPFSAAADVAGNVQKRGGQDRSILNDPGSPSLLDDKEPVRSIAGVGYLNGSGESRGDDFVHSDVDTSLGEWDK
jgi:hypothetical protein